LIVYHEAHEEQEEKMEIENIPSGTS